MLKSKGCTWEEAAARQKLQEKWAIAFHEAAREGRTICLFAHPLWPGKLIMNTNSLFGLRAEGKL